MNKEVKALWIEALRSGRYRQGTGWLAEVQVGGGQTRYCCLGVLCELAVAAGECSTPVVDDDESLTLRYDEEQCFLPDAVAAWAEVDREGKLEVEPGRMYPRKLSTLNDEGVPFTEIANIIEREL